MRSGAILGIIFIVVSGVFSSCRSKRKIQTPPAVTTKADSSASNTAESLLNQSLKDWTYFSSKINLDFNNSENKVNASAHIRMYKDSLIWISAGMFGIEGMRILITKDSIAIMDKLKSKVTILKNGDLGSFSDIPLSVTQIQNLILARPVYALSLYKIISNDSVKLKIEYSHPKFTAGHCYNKSFLTIDSTLVKDKTTPNYAKASYSGFQVVEGHNFPYKTEVIVTGGKNNSEIKLEHSDVDFTTVLTFPFKIPSSYEKTN